MHSLQPELRDLAAAGAEPAAAAEQALAVENRTVLSVFEELRAALYVAVGLIVTGVGMVIKEHLDRIGPLTLILVLALAAAACSIPAIRAKLLGSVARPAAADYLLLLGALLVSVDLGYAESQFHLFGANWSRHLLILTVFHACIAYTLESRLVLAVALTTFAAWFGIERGAGTFTAWRFGTPELGVRALLCATVILVWRALDQHANRGRFRAVFEHFSANLAFWGVLGWCWDPDLRVLGVLSLLVLAAVAIRTALRSGTELFAVYGVGYAAWGLILVLAQTTDLSSFGAACVLAVVLAAVALLRRIHGLLRAAEP